MAETPYLAPDAKLPYCRGCGHASVVRQLSRALERLQLPSRSVVLTSDIGCVGLADSLFPFLHTVHTTHGRSTAVATGIALADSVFDRGGLKPIVLIGDGGAMIGLLHLVHAAQLNVDVTVLLHNNFFFGMTGGQHSALTPVGLTTSTTPGGNWIPPLDVVSLLRAAHAGFLARHLATDTDLDAAIADAIAYPGFALIEILELCTPYGARQNQLTGNALKEIATRQGYSLGRIEAAPARPSFCELYQQQLESIPKQRTSEEIKPTSPPVTLARELRLVVAGSAGERVQSAAGLLCQAALAAGLYVTQKSDNPVTQGTGFSLAEVSLSSEPIEYTGMEHPDAVIVASLDGWNELRANGTFARCQPASIVLMDEGLPDPPTGARVLRVPLRKAATPKQAALAGIAAWLARESALPGTIWEAALWRLPADRRADAAKAIEIGRQLAGSA